MAIRWGGKTRTVGNPSLSHPCNFFRGKLIPNSVFLIMCHHSQNSETLLSVDIFEEDTIFSRQRSLNVVVSLFQNLFTAAIILLNQKHVQ